MQGSRCENLHNIDLTPKVVFKNLLVVLFSTSETMATLENYTCKSFIKFTPAGQWRGPVERSGVCLDGRCLIQCVEEDENVSVRGKRYLKRLLVGYKVGGGSLFMSKGFLKGKTRRDECDVAYREIEENKGNEVEEKKKEKGRKFSSHSGNIVFKDCNIRGKLNWETLLQKNCFF